MLPEGPKSKTIDAGLIGNSSWKYWDSGEGLKSKEKWGGNMRGRVYDPMVDTEWQDPLCRGERIARR